MGRKNIKAEADGKTDKAALLQELGTLRRQFQELTQSLKQFKELFDNAVVGVYRTTPDGRIIMANSAFVQMLGYSSFEELSKRNVEEEGFAPGYPRSTFKELIEKEGKVVGLESSWTRQDGTTVFVRENARVICDRSGKTMYYEGVVEDITKRKKAEEGFEQYRLMVETAQDAIFFKDLKSRYIAFNKKTPDVLGLTREQVIGKNDYAIMPNKEEAKGNIEGDNIVFRTGKPLEIVRQITFANGRKHWFHVLKVPHFDNKGKIVGLVGICRDITEHKKTEEELKSTKQQIEFILGATKTGLDIIDSQFNIRFIDPEWQKIYGDPTGKKCYEYFMDRSQVCPGCGIPKSLQTKSITVSEEVLVKENNRPIQVTTIPFHNEKGEWLVAEVNVDISERKKAEEALRALLDATTESVLLVDKQLTVLTLNKTAAQRFGRAPEQLVGAHIQDSLSDSASPDVVKHRAEQINKVIRSGKPVRFEDERAGMIFDTSIYPVFDAKGKASSVAIFAKDVTEEKKSKAALAESRLRYQTLFDNAPVGIGVADKESHPLECNEMMLKMTGYSYAEIRQISIKDTYVNLQQRQELLKKLKRDGFVRDFEVKLKRKDGTVYDASLTIIPFILSGEKVLLTVQRDISEQKKAEEALRQGENKYRTLLENLPQKIFLKDKNSVYVSCNDNYARDLKIKPEEIAGKTDYDFYPEELAEKYRADDKKILKSGKTQDIEEKYVQDGKEAIVHTVKTPIKDKQGRTTAILGIFWDITQQKKAEEQLKVKDKAIASSINAIAIADPEGNLIYVNNSLLKTWGYRNSKQVLGKPVMNFWFNEKEATKVIEALHKQGSWIGEMTGLKKNGLTFEAQASTSSVRNENGDVLCLMASFLDVTESKQKEAQLNSYREKMTRAEQLASLGTLSATLAHELTQPLTVIGLSIENTLAQLKTAPCDNTITEQLDDALSAVANASLIVERFRNFARKSSGKTVSKVDLKTVAERIMKLLNEYARRAKVSLRIKGMNRLPSIYSNEKDLEQLFFALFDNAIQAADGKEDRQVVVSASVEDEHIELRFSDNCGGIAPEHIDKIFEPFFTTKPTGEGTGLGLPIVQRIVEQCSGRIWVKSKPNIGSTFFVTLPINKDKPLLTTDER